MNHPISLESIFSMIAHFRVMAGRPVFQSRPEYRLWKRIRGEGFQRILGSVRGGLDGAIDSVLSQEGNLHSAILMAAMDGLVSKGHVDGDVLHDLVLKSRSVDCMPSVHAARIMLTQHDSKSATELLSSSSRSQEVFNRSLMAAEILSVEGDRVNARSAAVRAFGTDPTDDRVYSILMEVDPDGGWGERQNIQSILSGGRPENKVGSGRLQELYSIYYEWFRGSHDVATTRLISSEHYRSRDPEFLLASARISVDERDWRSACMVYDSILGSSPEFVRREAASAHLEYGDVAGALAILSSADRTFPGTMRLLIDVYRRSGDREEMMDCIRSFLDSEFSTFEDHVGITEMLLSDGMMSEARSILDRLSPVYGNDPDILTLESRYMAACGDMQGAISASAKAVHFDQNCIRARVQRAQLYHLTGRDDYASKECDNILRRDLGNRDAMSLSRDILFSKGDLVGAGEMCDRLISDDPKDTDSMIVLARCRASSDDVSGAYDILDRCLRADPERENAVRVVGTMVSLGMDREAVSACRELVKRFPDDPDILRLKGNSEYALGDHMAASVSFASAAAASPYNPDIWHSKGMADEARGDLESAETAYERALALDTGNPDHWISRSVVQELRGDFHGCVQSLNRAIGLDPGSVYALVRKASIVNAQGRYGEAMHLLDMAQDISPDDLDVRRERMSMQMSSGHLDDAVVTGDSIMSNGGDASDASKLCRCHTRLGQFEEAVAVADTALTKYPDDRRLIAARAEAQASMGTGKDPSDEQVPEGDDPGSRLSTEDIYVVTDGGPMENTSRIESEDLYGAGEQGIPRKPGRTIDSEEDARSFHEMASSLLSAGEVKGAIRTIDRAIALEPEDPGHQCLKARAVMRSGDVEGASIIVNSALKANPDDPDLHEVLGDIRVSSGDHRGALQEYEAATMFGGDSASVYRKRGEVQERIGDHGRAVESYSIAVAKDPSDMDTAERLTCLMMSRGDLMGADHQISSMEKVESGSPRTIVLRAELSGARHDDDAIMDSYNRFRGCSNPGADLTVRMVKVLEGSGHGEEARVLMGAKPRSSDADKSVKRYAEKVMRRAVVTKTPLDDPDLLMSLGLEPSMSSMVSDYLSDIGEYGRIDVGSEEFRRMESLSHDIVIKIDWRDLESEPRLPLEKVFVSGNFRDADDAKRLVAYVFKAMHCDIGRNADPRVEDLSMRLPKGMGVFEIMSECGIGVYEARQVQSLII